MGGASAFPSGSTIARGGVRVLVGPVVFKTIEAGVPRLAGSIPVRLRHLRFCGCEPAVSGPSEGCEGPLF